MSANHEPSQHKSVDKEVKADPTAAQDTKKDAKEIYKLLSEMQVILLKVDKILFLSWFLLAKRS